MPRISLTSPPAGIPAAVTVSPREDGHGGQALIYFDDSGQYAVKVYRAPRADKQALLRKVMEIFRNVSRDREEYFVKPLALIDTIDGKPAVGFLMRRVHHPTLASLMLSPRKAAKQYQQGMTWGHYFVLARGICDSISVLHGEGCGHSDIHPGNFLADPRSGRVVMLEADGVVVPGELPPEVDGLPGYIAPEILERAQVASTLTDRHSLAVVVLHTLLLRNVLQPLQTYDARNDVADQRLGFGEHAVFSEHPSDPRNRPVQLGLPLYREGALSYKALTPRLQQLTEKALIAGLREPALRPLAKEWRDALAAAIDELLGCRECGQFFPYPHWLAPAGKRRCPFCGGPCATHPAVLRLYEERRAGNFVGTARYLVLAPGFELFADVVDPGRIPPRTRRATPRIGRFGSDRTLHNQSDQAWIAETASGERRQVEPGEGLQLDVGTFVHFGPDRRAVKVVETGS
jgi:DNA-binding helix-hairpin-helix protein with protein kinase domain